MHASDQGERRARIAIRVLQALQQLAGIDDLRTYTEAVAQFITPLLAQHRGTHDKQATGVLARAQLRPDQPGFDRLAQTHLVGDQESVAGRFEVLQHRLELVGQKLSVGGVEAVDQVRQLAAQPEMRDEAAQVTGTTEPPAPDALVWPDAFVPYLFQ